jgi:lipopolysaccharide/colanic/teichoic acid biosynthesis glycosyltransferase
MYAKFFKRVIDFVLSFVALIVLSPVLLILALLIKLTSRGPVFFCQERLGKDGTIFKIIKFRTMVVNAEKIGDGLFVYGDHDKRITGIGKFLRKTSLDELPQLFNVFMGNMSVIGPRPPVTYFPYDGFDNYPEWAKKRFRVRPGITGLAQIKTRTTAPWDKRIEIDNEYVDGISVWQDIKIFFGTFAVVLFHKNVYPESKEQIDNAKKTAVSTPEK